MTDHTYWIQTMDNIYKDFPKKQPLTNNKYWIHTMDNIYKEFPKKQKERNKKESMVNSKLIVCNNCNTEWDGYAQCNCY